MDVAFKTQADQKKAQGQKYPPYQPPYQRPQQSSSNPTANKKTATGTLYGG